MGGFNHLSGLPLVAETVKRLSTMWETWFSPWVRKISWRRKWHPTPVLLPGESHGWRSLVGHSPRGQNRTRLSDFTFFFLSGLHVGGTAPLTPTSPSQPLSALCPSHSCSLPQPVQERLKPGSWRTGSLVWWRCDQVRTREARQAGKASCRRRPLSWNAQRVRTHLECGMRRARQLTFQPSPACGARLPIKALSAWMFLLRP